MLKIKQTISLKKSRIRRRENTKQNAEGIKQIIRQIVKYILGSSAKTVKTKCVLITTEWEYFDNHT